jgi:glycosyltransferase involved in cell wall biosynthesis
MRAALPVVAYGVGGVREQVDDGRSGELVPVGDVRALARHVVELVRAPERLRLAGAAGRARLEERFSYEGMLDALEEVYAVVRAPGATSRRKARR